jgi:hypothetical protein
VPRKCSVNNPEVGRLLGKPWCRRESNMGLDIKKAHPTYTKTVRRDRICVANTRSSTRIPSKGAHILTRCNMMT